MTLIIRFRYITSILIFQTLFAMSCQGQSITPMKQDSAKDLLPYLSSHALYGYADFHGNIIIDPQYERGDFFHNGVAVVRKKGAKDMLINAHNEPIPIPIKYSTLRLLPYQGYTLVEFTEEYSNRWRFWEWKFLPDFSLFGTPNRNRLFDTKVLREKRSLYWLEGQTKIQSKKGGKGKGETYFFVSQISENMIQVDDKLYHLNVPDIKRIAKDIVINKNVEGKGFLQNKGSFLQVVDSTGKRIMPIQLRSIKKLTLRVEGSLFTLHSEVQQPLYYKLGDFYEDEQENIYVHPNLRKTFPREIKPYPFDDSITAKEILKKTQSIAPVPKTNTFLLTLDFGKRVFALDTDGNWHDPNTNIGKITVVSRAGNILWPGYETELGKPKLPNDAAITSIRPFAQKSNFYLVRIAYKEQRLTGVWDKKSESWIMPPEYHEIASRISYQRFLTFKITKDGKWGVYDIINRKIHIPAVYDFISADGWAYRYDETSKGFYLNLKTKQEFREKEID